MQDYYDDPGSSPLIPRLIMLAMFVFGVFGLFIAEQILTGWLPLGDRINIPRSSINFIEWLTIIGSTIYGVACLRTSFGMYRRERSSLAWSQWMSFITFITGFALTMSVVIPAVVKYFLLVSQHPVTDDMDWDIFVVGLALVVGGVVAFFVLRRSASTKRLSWGGLLATLGGVALVIAAMLDLVLQHETRVPNIRSPELIRLLPGLPMMVVGFLSYLYTRPRGSFSTENRVAIGLSPSKLLRIQLAKSPSAGAIIGFVTIFLGFTMATDLFLAPTSVASILTNVSSKGIIAIGVTILMISGEFDLSVGSILGVISMVFMVFMTEGVPLLDTGPVPEFLAAILALLVAIGLGLINGLLLVTTRIPSFIVTLGTLLAFRAITLVVIAGGRILRYRDYFSDFPQVYISPWVFVGLALVGLVVVAFVAYLFLPRMWQKTRHLVSVRAGNGDFGTTLALWQGFQSFVITGIFAVAAAWLVMVVLYHLDQMAIVQVGFFDIANGRWEFTLSEVSRGLVSIQIPRDANFRNAIVWWLIFVVFFHIMLTRTSYGNAIYAVGGNVGASRAQGVNVNRVKVGSFVLTAFLTGVAAIYEVARNPGVDPLKGQGWELEVIAMTVIGGALLSGGYGSVIGSLLGALIFGMLQTGLVLVGIDSRVFQGTVGVIIIVAVVLNTSVRGRQT